MRESPSSLSSASDQVGESPAVDLTGKIMVVIIIVVFTVVVSALAVHLYAKVFWWRRTSQSQSQSQSQSRSQVTGLDPSVLKSLPVSVFQPHDSSKENGVECSVCISELVEGEKLRVLPKCNHGFHVDCIDTWFQSHATCPLCRALVVVAPQAQPGDLESQSFPTNVLIWGNQTQITSSSSTTAASLEESTSNNTTSTTSKRDRMLVIDIPGGHGEEEENLSSSSSSATATTSRFAEDDLKSPVLRRLRSLRRLLSNNRLNHWTPTSSTQTTTKGEEGHN